MGRPTVLVVDDEVSVRSFVQQVLNTAGYETHTAESGPQALKVVESRGPFDVCVLDLVMPEMNGTELADRIRRGHPESKILYFPGFADQLFEEKRRLGADEAFIEKPVTIHGLREAVSLLLYGHTQGGAKS